VHDAVIHVNSASVDQQASPQQVLNINDTDVVNDVIAIRNLSRKSKQF